MHYIFDAESVSEKAVFVCKIDLLCVCTCSRQLDVAHKLLHYLQCGPLIGDKASTCDDQLFLTFACLLLPGQQQLVKFRTTCLENVTCLKNMISSLPHVFFLSFFNFLFNYSNF